jgi:hypothetical protein
MTTPCLKEETIEFIKSDVITIKGDVKELLEIKNKVVGGIKTLTVDCTALGFCIGTLISIFRG